MTTYPHGMHLRKPHFSLWLLVVGLAAALIGLGSWVIVDQTGSQATPAAQPIHGLASAQRVAMLDARLAALNSAGKQSMASYYSSDAVFEDRSVTPPIVVRGGTQVASLNEGFSKVWALAGLRMTRESDVIQTGNYAAHAVRLGDYRFMAVFEFDQSGRIAHQWVFGRGMGQRSGNVP